MSPVPLSGTCLRLEDSRLRLISTAHVHVSRVRHPSLDLVSGPCQCFWLLFPTPVSSSFSCLHMLSPSTVPCYCSRRTYLTHESGSCIRLLFSDVVSSFWLFSTTSVSGFCLRLLSPVRVSGFCLGLMSPVHVSSSCIRVLYLVHIFDYCFRLMSSAHVSSFFLQLPSPDVVSCLQILSPVFDPYL